MAEYADEWKAARESQFDDAHAAPSDDEDEEEDAAVVVERLMSTVCVWVCVCVCVCVCKSEYAVEGRLFWARSRGPRKCFHRRGFIRSSSMSYKRRDSLLHSRQHVCLLLATISILPDTS